MANNQKKRQFNGMSYRDVQRANSASKVRLPKEDQKWLKENRYKNIGRDNVISLYQKTEELLDKYRFQDFTLEELFLEADRIGNKYLTPQETEEASHKLSQAINQVGEEVDKHFPDTEIEVLNFSNQTVNKPRRKDGKRL